MGTLHELPTGEDRSVDLQMDWHEKQYQKLESSTSYTTTMQAAKLIAGTLHQLGVTVCCCSNRIVAALGGIDVRDGS